ncbi:MAG: shikimate dehydrogenase [Tahibacter sp.]
MPNPPLYAVFGHPVAHSRSPAIHRAFAAQFGRSIDYRAIDAAPVDFATQLSAFRAQGGIGANVTLPLKSLAYAAAARCSDAAVRSGVVNTLVPLGESDWQGHNTDGAGLIADLAERHRVDLRERDALLLGAGGAAQAVAYALLDAGVRSLTIVNRDAQRADGLADRIGMPDRVHVRYWSDLRSIGSFDLLMNATSAGVRGDALDLPFSIVASRALCYDLSYGAAATGFLAWARAAGAAQCLDGLGMLVEQAAEAYALWFGERPDTTPVYASLRAELDGA